MLPPPLKAFNILYSLGIGEKEYNMPQTQQMRNPMFANFHYNPGSHNSYDQYEDLLDKLKQ